MVSALEVKFSQVMLKNSKVATIVSWFTDSDSRELFLIAISMPLAMNLTVGIRSTYFTID